MWVVCVSALSINPDNWVMHTQQQLVANLFDCALHLFNGFDKHAHLHRSAVTALPARHCVAVLQYQSDLCVEVCSHRRVSLRETPNWCLIKSFIRPDHAACARSIMAPCWIHRAALLLQISPFAVCLAFSLSVAARNNTRKIEATTCESNAPFENLVICLWRLDFKALNNVIWC